MAGYITDLIIVTAIVVGLTAIMGVLLNGIGKNVFGGRNKQEFVDRCAKYQSGWNMVGGSKK